MGKITGFLEFERVRETCELPDARVGHWREFVRTLATPAVGTQAARCMDCGVPFCAGACPVSNVIPDFNDLVYRDDWRRAAEVLHRTNNFPEFTGRVCPAPCEAACTLNLQGTPVGIKSIERAIVERAWEEGWIRPEPGVPSGRAVAIVGSGPAGLAAAQQLARAGHAVTVFERGAQPGGLLRYGIPDFKLDKALVDRRLVQLAAEGVRFQTGVTVGVDVSAEALRRGYDAVLLAGGAEVPRDLPVPGRDLGGVYPAMAFLGAQNRVVSGELDQTPISAAGKHVIVIGGGDTGSDCVGTSVRQGAASVTQLELLPRPPDAVDPLRTWPRWPNRYRVSSSHEEGCTRVFSVSTVAIVGDDDGQARVLRTIEVGWADGRMTPRPGTEREWPADLVLLAMGFLGPTPSLLDAFGVDRDGRGNAVTTTFATGVPGVFAAGDLRRGQSLVVWAIREGRDAAAAVDRWLGSAGAR